MTKLRRVGTAMRRRPTPRTRSNPDGKEYAASYLVKAITLGHFEGWIGIDWLAQRGGASVGASMDSFASR